MEVQGGSSQRHSNSDSSSRLFINRRDSSGDAEFLTKNAEHAIESWVLNAPDPPPCFQDIKENFKDIFNNHKNPDASPVKPFINFIINIRLQNGPVVSAQPHLLLFSRPRLNPLISRTPEAHSNFQATAFL
jgi:hypothetical protein